jgi:hypothetical protein
MITAFASARHLSLSWARSIQSIPLLPTPWSSILILFSHPCLGPPSVSFPQPPPQTPEYAFIIHTCYMARPSHSFWFYHPNSIGWAVQIIKLIIMHTHHILKHTVNHIVKCHLVSWNCGLLYQSLMTDDYRAVVEWHVARENQSALRNLPQCYSPCTNWTWALLWRNPGSHQQKLLSNCISYGTDAKWCRNLNVRNLQTMAIR